MVDAYLLEGVECDLQASSSFLLTDLRSPVDVFKDKLDRLAATVPTVNHVALLIHDDGRCGRAGRLQLQL